MSGDIDLSELQLLPQWAKEPLQHNPYQNYEGETASPRDRRGGRDDRGRGGPGRRPADARGRDSQRPPQNRGPRPEGGRNAGPRPSGPRRDQGGRPGRRPERDGRPERPPENLPALEVLFQPEPHGAESMVKQIKSSGRAYPVFELARMILKKPERHQVVLQAPAGQSSGTAPALFLCTADQSLWLAEADAVQHVLQKQLETFYQPERVSIDPPKGNFTCVGVCGLSGAVLGPPNHHDYPASVRRLYLERFSNMPFEAFKSRIQLVKDEAVLNQWKEQQSSKTEYVAKPIVEGAEPVRLPDLEAVKSHFLAEHRASQIQQVASCVLGDTKARQESDPLIQKVIRRAWDSEVRFPGKTGPALIHSLSKNGLQFFKWNKGITHVAAVRPKRFDPAKSPVAEGVSKILDWVAAHPGKTRSDLLKALVPKTEATPAAPMASPSVESAAPTAAEAVPPAATVPAPIPAPEVSVPNASSVLSDLHWLLHEGYIVEFANNQLDLLRQNEKQAKAPQPAAAATPEPEVAEPEPKKTGTQPEPENTAS